MEKFIKYFGRFIPASELDRFEFTVSKADRDAAQARSIELFEKIEQGGGFNTFAAAN